MENYIVKSIIKICHIIEIKHLIERQKFINDIYNRRWSSPILINNTTGQSEKIYFEEIANHFGIPITFENLSEYVPSGFPGNEIENIFVRLIDNANGDIEKAKKGIIVLKDINNNSINLAIEFSNKNSKLPNVFDSLHYILKNSKIKINYHGRIVELDTSGITIFGIANLSSIEMPINETINPYTGLYFNLFSKTFDIDDIFENEISALLTIDNYRNENSRHTSFHK